MLFKTIITEFLLNLQCLGIRVRFAVKVRFRFRDRVSVRGVSFRDLFPVLLHARHYSMLTVRHRNHNLN